VGPGPARIVDAHHHLWDLAANYYPWLTDRVGPRMYGDYAAIRRNYLVDDFRRDIGALPVVKSVHVQAEHDHADPVRETRWLQAQAERHGYPHAIVAYADLSAPTAQVAAVLDAHCGCANVRGVRQMVHEVLVPQLGHDVDYLADSRWQRNLGLLPARSLLFELQILPPQDASAAAVVAMHPDLQFVLAHAGQPRDRSEEGIAQWRTALRRLAALPNVAIKLSGFGMFDSSWSVDSLRPLVLWAIECFGPGRVMFGSNFPVDGLMRDYAGVWRAYDEITRECSDAERDAMFHGTASRLYRI
jgi:predicted TIM-barrel fold metal-dependent hydrolase